MANETGLDVIKEIFEKYNTIAVCGMSRDANKPAQYVPAYMQRQGYRVIPINPYTETILGQRSYASLHDIPETIEILNVFRRSDQVPEVIEQAAARKKEKGDVAAIWLQSGIRSEAGRKLAEQAGIIFVQDRCMMVDFRRLFPNGRRP